MSSASRSDLCDRIIPSIILSLDKILDWFKENKRNFPWRKEREPYKILVTEMMLRRTKAEKVAEIYHDFFTRFPDVRSLAEADPNEVHEILHSLGLRWRTQTIISAAKQLVLEYNGIIPEKVEKLLSLPGVGRYVAHAVRIFAYGKRHILLDSNVLRIVCRLSGLSCKDSLRKNKELISCLDELAGLIPSDKIKLLNLALLDIGSLVCLPRSPRCKECPLKEKCQVGRRVSRETNSP